jgi:hypothetical protein
VKKTTVFVSYAHADSPTAARVAEGLRGAGLNVWIDEAEIRPGQSFIEGVNDGLENAAYVVLLCSAASLASHSVSREWMSTLARRDAVLLPVKIGAVQLPAILADLLYVDLTSNFEAGMNRLVRFLREEGSSPVELEQRSDNRPNGAGDLPSRGGETLSLATAQLHEIRKVAKHCVDSVALKEYIFDTGIDEGSLKGDSVHEQLIGLLHVLNRDGELVAFAKWLGSERRKCVQVRLARLRAEAAEEARAAD